jgi:uncharacterized phiE125 gp8 family phage protein
MDIRLITAPTNEPVSLPDAQAHLRVGVDGAENAIIAAYLQAARESVEAHTGRVLMPQTWQIVLPEFPADNGAIMLPKPPLVSVTSVAITNADGNAETISGALYQVATPSGAHAQPGYLAPAYGENWPETQPDTVNAVRVTFSAGYVSAANVPAALRAAILLITGELYENREATTARPLTENPAVKRLLDPYRVWSL